MLCKAQSSPTEWMVCLQVFMRWHFWGLYVCVFFFFFFDLLQDEMILTVFLSGLNLKLENFTVCPLHPSPHILSYHPPPLLLCHLNQTLCFYTQSYLWKLSQLN